MRKSTAIDNIVSLVIGGIISIDDLAPFSAELKESVEFMIKKW